MGLKYLSIDVETGGLDPNNHDILEFAAVFDDLGSETPDYDSLPKFHAYIVQDTYRTGAYAAVMHERIWRVLKDGVDPTDPNARFLSRDVFASDFQAWLYECGYAQVPEHVGEQFITSSYKITARQKYRDETPASVTVLGKNFALFDFELTEADVTAISALNRDERVGPNPDEFNYIP